MRVPPHLQRESDIQRDVIAFWERLGCVVIPTSERRRKEAGIGMLDLYVLCARKQASWWFDVKQPGEALRESQQAFVADCRRAGISCGWGGMTEAHAFAARLGLIARVSA